MIPGKRAQDGPHAIRGCGGRRALRAASWIVAAITAIAACHGDLSVSGTLAVDVAGLGTSPVPGDGGRITVAAGGAQSGAPATPSIAGTWVGSLPDGDYMVDYMPPEGYKLASTEIGTRATHVSAGEVSRVSFNVSVDSGAIGTMALAVPGLSGACIADRGTVVLQRIDVSRSPLTIAIPATGVDTVTVVAGTYTLGFNPPSGYQTTSPTKVPGVTVAAGESVPVIFAVRATWAELYIVADLDGPPWPSDGGSVMLLRTDTAGQVATTIPVPLYPTEGYYTDVSLVPGRYEAAYAPPGGFRSAANSGPAELSLCPADRVNLTFAAAPTAGVRAR